MKSIFTSIIIVFFTSSVLATTAIIFRENSSVDRQIETLIKENTPNDITFHRGTPVSSQGELRQALNKNPDFLIFLDPISANTYHRYVMYNNSRVIPSVIIAASSSNYSTYSAINKATTYGIEPSIEDIQNRISRLVPGVNKIGALYSSSTNVRVEAKIAQYGRNRVETSPLLSALSSESVIGGLESISSRKEVALWVAGREFNSFLSRDENVKEVIGERIGAIVTEERVVAEAIKEKVPVLYLYRDVNTIAKFTASRLTMFITDPSTAGSGDRQFCGYSMRFCTSETSKTYSSPQLSSASSLLSRAKNSYENMVKVATSDAIIASESISIDTVIPANDTVVDQTDSISESAIASIDSLSSEVKTEDTTKKTELVSATRETTTSTATRRVVVNVVNNDIPQSRITITTPIANIFSAVSPEPLLLAVAKAGDDFILVDSIGEYLKIVAWGKTGFIHRSEVIEIVEVIEIDDSDSEENSLFALITVKQLFYVLLAAIIILVTTVMTVIIRFKSVRNRRHRYRAALIVARKPSKVKIIDDNKKVSLKKHLYNLGALLTSVRSPKKLRKRMINHMPDIILVDWEVDQWIIEVVQKQLQKYRLSSATTVLFYNVSEDEQAHFNGDFGDAEIHVCIGALSKEAISSIFSRKNETETRESSSLDTSSYLAGMIHGNALQDILQLIETGRKNGCLVIEDDSPYSAIFFKDGTIVYAVTKDDIRGVQAIYNSLDMKSGSFYFILDKTPHEEDVYLSVMAVLMEWSAIEDRKTMQIQAVAH